MKRIITTLLIVALTMTLSTNSVFAQTMYVEGTLVYTINDDNEITIVGYYGRDEEVSVPSTIAGIPVCHIGSGAFVDSDAKTVSLPDTIVDVAADAFDKNETTIEYHDSNGNDVQSAPGGIIDIGKDNDNPSEDNKEDTNKDSSNKDTSNKENTTKKDAPKPIEQVDMGDEVEIEEEFIEENDATFEKSDKTTTNSTTKKNNTSSNSNKTENETTSEETFITDDSGIIRTYFIVGMVIVIAGASFVIYKKKKTNGK